MEKDRRIAAEQPGERLERKLNDEQLITLRNLEHFGWELKFLRHPLFQDPIAVIHDSETDKYAILEESGEVNENHGHDFRE